MEIEEVQKAVERAAEAIVTRTPRSWAVWAVDLVKLLEHEWGEQGFAQVELLLGGVRDVLSVRIQEGHW